MNQNTVKYIPLCVAIVGVAIGLHLHNQKPAPTPFPSTPAVVAVSPLRAQMEQVRNARVRLMLGYQERLARAEKLPGGKELVARLREENRRAEESYQQFLKQDAEYQRLHASLAKLRTATRSRATDRGC